MRPPMPSREVETPARRMRLWSRASSPESRQLPLVRPLTHLPSATWATCSSISRASPPRTDTTSVVAPTLTALTHHAHAPTAPTTTPRATPGDRHPQSEGSSPSTGMQRLAITGYYVLAQPRVLLAKHGREARHSYPCRSRRASANKMGPVLEQELLVEPGALSATWASCITPQERNKTSRRRAPRASRQPRVAPDSQAPPQTHRARERGRRVVSGPWAPGGTERRRGRDVARGGAV